MRKIRPSPADDLSITESCGDVFQDIGFSPEEAAILNLQSDLMIALVGIIQRRGLPPPRRGISSA